ncbi:MAG: ABC transporter ATP-binding protein [Aestuariibacter sp.]|nr:ABC transporter ATP-binding protein [Aestuariibacter sp.]
MTQLDLKRLTKTFTPGETAVSDLNLTLNDGELMVLLGPSGCGKTTTLRMIAGLLPPTSGDIQFDGQSVLTVPPEQRGAVMVFQEHALFPFMTVGDNIAYGLKMRKLDKALIQKRVTSALKAIHLPGIESRWPAQLSGGQQQRIALARALVVRPKLLLLDEPLSSLDRSLRQDLRHMIRTLQQEAGITTLFVTHDQAEAVAIADRIGVMINGRLQQVGTPQSFYEQPANAQIARFFGASNFLPGKKDGQIVHTDIGDVEIKPSPLADGPVLLTVRPEAIEIGANGHNNFKAAVKTFQYGAPHCECIVQVNEIPIQLTPAPYQQVQPNSNIVVHLPRERICVLPAEGVVE